MAVKTMKAAAAPKSNGNGSKVHAAPAPSAMGLLKSMAAQASSPAKTKKHDDKLRADIPALGVHITRFLEAKREAEKWESIRVTEDAQIISAAAPERRRLCRKAERFESSIDVNGKLMLTQTCRYSAVPQANEAELVEAFGDDFGRYFHAEMKIALTPDAAGDEAFLSKLIEALGESEFARRFSVTRTLTPTEAFHRDLTMQAAVEEKARPFIEAEVIKSAKPSLKVA